MSDIIKEYYVKRINFCKSDPVLKDKLDTQLKRIKIKLDALKREEQLGLYAIYGKKAKEAIKQKEDRIFDDFDVEIEKMIALSADEELHITVPKQPIYIYEEDVSEITDMPPMGSILAQAPSRRSSQSESEQGSQPPSRNPSVSGLSEEDIDGEGEKHVDSYQSVVKLMERLAQILDLPTGSITNNVYNDAQRLRNEIYESAHGIESYMELLIGTPAYINNQHILNYVRNCINYANNALTYLKYYLS